MVPSRYGVLSRYLISPLDVSDTRGSLALSDVPAGTRCRYNKASNVHFLIRDPPERENAGDQQELQEKHESQRRRCHGECSTARHQYRAGRPRAQQTEGSPSWLLAGLGRDWEIARSCPNCASLTQPRRSTSSVRKYPRCATGRQKDVRPSLRKVGKTSAGVPGFACLSEPWLK